MEVVQNVQQQLLIVQHVHLHQPVLPVQVDTSHPDPHVPCVPVKSVPHVIQPVEPVQHVNQVIICQVVLVHHVQVKCHNVPPVPQMEVHVQNVKALSISMMTIHV